MLVDIFEKDGQTVWEANNIFSMAVAVEDTTLNLDTLFEQVEKFMVWVKAGSKERVEAQAKSVAEMINKGTLVPARIFSTVPNYEGQQSDINPSTGEVLNRYSRVRLCTPEQKLGLHRTFIEAKPTTVAPPVEAPVEEVGAEL